MGAAVMDADAISRATTAAGGTAIDAIRATFGAMMVSEDGALDRDQMRGLIFSDPGAKARLEAIVHPLVGQAIAEQARQAEVAGHRCLVFDIPLLVESKHWRTTLDRVLVVDCTEAMQIARVGARNAMATDDVKRIIASQAPRLNRLRCADLVVFNDGISLDDLATQVRLVGGQFGL
jgi:dephospho-CoA kinase